MRGTGDQGRRRESIYEGGIEEGRRWERKGREGGKEEGGRREREGRGCERGGGGMLWF